MEIATIQQIKVQLIAKNCAICTTDNALSTLPCDNVRLRGNNTKAEQDWIFLSPVSVAIAK